MANNKWWFEEEGGLKLIKFSHFEQYSNFVYFITTRHTGKSTGQLASFNLGFQEYDSTENVIANRKSLANYHNIPFDSFIFLRQTHSNNIKIVDDSDKAKGLLSKTDAIQDTDGYILTKPDICPIVMTADCVPVILLDPIKNIAGVFHAGWRGTLKLIAQKGLKIMQNIYGTNPADVLVSIGPSIGPCCYEVGNEVIDEVKKIFPYNFDELIIKKDNKKTHLDLWTANKIQLKHVGIIESNIIICNSCTYHNPETFFSYRFSKGVTGRMGTGIYLRSNSAI
ncbi:MAG: peptidoglycan editing factor PgeF [Bacteroidia bacterium]|nr:peptidoglycan editing factor PgeF [Bacteroidia bacterium]